MSVTVPAPSLRTAVLVGSCFSTLSGELDMGEWVSHRLRGLTNMGARTHRDRPTTSRVVQPVHVSAGIQTPLSRICGYTSARGSDQGA